MRRKRDERAVSFQHRSIHPSPLPMGDQEFETQRRFLHKEPNNGSQDIFFSYFLALLFILSFALFFFAFPFNFPLLEEGEELLNEARNACRSQKGREKRRERERKNKVTVISLSGCLAFTHSVAQYVSHM